MNNKYERTKKIKIILIKCFIVIIYFAINFFVLGLDMALPTLLISIAFLISLLIIYDTNLSPFSCQNLFYIFFLLSGCFFRYLWIGINGNDFLKIAYIPLSNTPGYHTKTSVIILIVVISLAIGLKISKKFLKNNKKSYNDMRSYPKFAYWVLILTYFILLIIIIGYKLSNLRLSTELSYGTFDNAITTLSYILKFVAYYNLVQYMKDRKPHELLFYLFYVIPIIIISLLSAWKGALIFEIIIICIIYGAIYKKIKIMHLAWITIAIIFIFPFISLRRINLTYNLNNKINFSSMFSYLKENNIISYLSNRFSYYDELYYVLNVGESTINSFLDKVGGMTSRLIFAFIPRVLYPDKGIVNTGLQVTHYIYGYPTLIYNNLGITYVGDMWVYYGVLGVIIGNILVGIFIQKMENNNLNTSSNLAKYAVISIFLIGFCEGDLLSSLVQLFLILIVLFIFKKFFIFGSFDTSKKKLQKTRNHV